MHDACPKCKYEKDQKRLYRRQLVLTCFSHYIEGGSAYDLGECLHRLYEYAFKARRDGHTEASKTTGTRSDS
jgi:hypothetical protein